MRKVILNLAVSLDGFIEGPNGEFDWCFVDQDYGMTDFVKQVDAIFFGRKSYELTLQMGSNPYPNMTKYVFSRRLNSVDRATLINSKVSERVEEIRRQRGMDIWRLAEWNWQIPY
jgi:dihydrofolate reductase